MERSLADTSAEPTLDQLPFEGELHRAGEKKYLETVLIVPFYGAKKSALHRHVSFLNDLGYDVAVFSILKESRTLQKSLFSSKEYFGMMHIWADQVEALLNALPGKKIIFAFSNPSASAIKAIARRNAVDVTGLVCDSGPANNMFDSLINYFTFEEPLRFMPLKFLAAAGSRLMWSSELSAGVHRDLDALPKDFKILSIRGWKDRLITTHNIDQVFEPHLNIDWQKLSLPQAGHLNGLRDFKEEYAEPVQKFLQSISHRL
jgi:pimeloyl-ACP methyl ester carboxylesterase